MAVTQDIFGTEYTDFDNKIGSSDGDECIWRIKDIRDGNSHLWHHKYSLPCTKVLVLLLHVDSYQRFLVLSQQSVPGST